MFQRVADTVTRWAGSQWAVLIAFGVIVIWAASGPVAGFSDTWQLIINTGTTIVTFVMVFLIQATQNRDNRAIHVKLDELIHVTHDAREELVGIEDGSEQDIEDKKQGGGE